MREIGHSASLCRSGLLRTFEDEDEPGGEGDPEGNLAASGVSGQAPPAGPQWVAPIAAAWTTHPIVESADQIGAVRRISAVES